MDGERYAAEGDMTIREESVNSDVAHSCERVLATVYTWVGTILSNRRIAVVHCTMLQNMFLVATPDYSFMSASEA
jgi:hypothetical protein